ncbi:DUF4262 domain-containing protein [Streptomyces sp. NPDC047072]|uniref:DUF4262 domain-containing protein n=1 Tax=Streptomyces sp. NPDC047072 TaxID=3154809 RepID=UPI00340076DC
MTSGPYLQRVAGIVAQHGYAVQYVGGNPGTGARSFAYTVGLHTQPGRDYELAASGLSAETSHSLLHTLAVALVDQGFEPIEGLQVSGLLQGGLDLRLRQVDRPEDLGIVHALYGVTPTLWQAVWPDKYNRFLGDAHCQLPSESQPLL